MGDVKWDPERLYNARLCVPGSTKDPPSRINWSRLLQVSQSEGTAGILYHKLGASPIKEELSKIFRHIQARNVRALHELNQLREAFAPCGIQYIPMKGAFLVSAVYPNYGMRDLGDIDIMVPSSQLLAVHEILEQMGYRSEEGKVPNPRIGAFKNSLLYDHDTRLPIHLHWHILNTSVSLRMCKGLDVISIWEGARLQGPDRVELNMRPHHMLLHLSEHALKHSYSRWIYLADIAWVLKCYEKVLEKEALLRTGSRWGLLYPLFFSLRILWDVTGLINAKDLIKDIPIHKGWETKGLLASVLAGRPRYGTRVLGYLAMGRDIWAKGRFILETLFPPADELKRLGRDPSIAGYLLRLVRAFLRATISGGGSAWAQDKKGDCA